jgi:uncharacterized cupredoxin-like copper-binding protein
MRTKSGLILIFALSLVVAACGGGDSDTTKELVLVAGFPPGDTTKTGFGVEGEDITSPGPTIRVRKGETVTITFENAHYLVDGRPFPEPHNFTVVEDKDVPEFEMELLWGAHVGGFGDVNLEAGERGSVTFTAETAGSFDYVCAVIGHIGAGMWGRFIVEE